jgi:hypothetical protein
MSTSRGFDSPRFGIKIHDCLGTTTTAAASIDESLSTIEIKTREHARWHKANDVANRRQGYPTAESCNPRVAPISRIVDDGNNHPVWVPISG